MTRTVTRRELVAALDENQTALSRRAARESWPYTEYLCRGGRRRHYLVAALPPDVQAALADQAAPPAPPAPPADPPLLDRSTPARRGRPQAAVPDAAWQAWLADYLDRRQPTAQSCYRRLQAQAASEGWTLPSLRTLRRRLAREIDPAVVTLRREGAPAVARRYPAQTRTVAGLHALEWINGDGYQPRPNLRWADGTISRPVIWWWQDVHSRKLLAWALDKSENADLIRLTLADLIATWGLPAHVTLDNTRAAANKTLSGQVPHRYRHGPPRWDEPLGLLPRLGIEVHWTGVVEGQGWGQAKPVERAHRDLRQDLDKHPALRAAWERAHAVPRAAYEDIVADVVHEYNGRPGRRTEMGAGAHSFDSVFARSYERATIRWPSDTQRRLLLLVPEVAIVDPAGGVALRAGRGPHGHNRYQHPALLAHTGARGRPGRAVSACAGRHK